ncbi:MAG: hypothetical protein WHF31_15210 [Candidatus Dehalobacter alkaniphilus]
MNVRDTLISKLNPLGYDVVLQGSYADDEPLPESFITYTVVDAPDASFYDDQPMLTHHRIQVVFYSKKMSLINTVPDLIYLALKTAGFVRDGKGRDYGFENEHYGLLVNYLFTERNE